MIPDAQAARSITSNHSSSALYSGVTSLMNDLGLELERSLVETYFRMAHSQWPFLLRHEALQWVESRRARRHQANVPEDEKWQDFFVHMVRPLPMACIEKQHVLTLKSRC